MPKINVLPREIYELIAAGEVVERPSSAVKELLENSVDAGATSITLEIQSGGIKYIRITDNGLVKAGAYLYDRIHAHLPLPTAEDGMMLNLRIEPELTSEKGFLCYLQDPIGWVITAPDEEALYKAIAYFVDEALWTEKGFTPVQIKE